MSCPYIWTADEGTSGCNLAGVTADQWASAQSEIAALKLALVKAVIPLEVLLMPGTINELSSDLQEAICVGIEAVRGVESGSLVHRSLRDASSQE